MCRKIGKTMSNEIQKSLLSMADPAYKAFQAPLLPTVEKDRIIGVRMPHLRKYAKSIKNTPLADEFLSSLPHFYYEEQNLHALLIADYEGQALFDALDAFLPHVDNWGTCDSLRPKQFKRTAEAQEHGQAKNAPMVRGELRRHIDKWLASPHLYTRRFAVEMLMLHFLDEPHRADFDRLAAVKSEEYYEQMMLAWYFAEALCHHFDAVLPYFKDGMLKEPVLKMAKRKAFDSLKLTKEQKQCLK